MAKTIEIDTNALYSDISALEGQTSALDRQSKNMFTALEELNVMWDGPANQAFSTQFTSDMGTFDNMIQLLKDLTERLRTCRKEYDSCEQRVESLVQSIQV